MVEDRSGASEKASAVTREDGTLTTSIGASLGDNDLCVGAQAVGPVHTGVHQPSPSRGVGVMLPCALVHSPPITKPSLATSPNASDSTGNISRSWQRSCTSSSMLSTPLELRTELLNSGERDPFMQTPSAAYTKRFQSENTPRQIETDEQQAGKGSVDVASSPCSEQGQSRQPRIHASYAVVRHLYEEFYDDDLKTPVHKSASEVQTPISEKGRLDTPTTSYPILPSFPPLLGNGSGESETSSGLPQRLRSGSAESSKSNGSAPGALPQEELQSVQVDDVSVTYIFDHIDHEMSRWDCKRFQACKAVSRKLFEYIQSGPVHGMLLVHAPTEELRKLHWQYTDEGYLQDRFEKEHAYRVVHDGFLKIFQDFLASSATDAWPSDHKDKDARDAPKDGGFAISASGVVRLAAAKFAVQKSNVAWKRKGTRHTTAFDLAHFLEKAVVYVGSDKGTLHVITAMSANNHKVFNIALSAISTHVT